MSVYLTLSLSWASLCIQLYVYNSLVNTYSVVSSYKVRGSFQLGLLISNLQHCTLLWITTILIKALYIYSCHS